jgi:glycyl-tRNA synthetase
VIRARFADAAYFVKRDSTQTLDEFTPRLTTLTFEKSLGSMLDKTRRVEALVEIIAPQIGLKGDELAVSIRAAHLCKADLATQMVVEMTSLQGDVGRIYALKGGETEAVAQAIYEHYLPRHAGDQVPQSRPGFAVGLADRLDTLMGLFAAGRKPSGARDPFALRRTAIGLVQMLVEHKQRIDLRQLLAETANQQPIEVNEEHINACLDFIATRQQALLLEEYSHDAVEAVLAGQGHDPAGAASAVSELGAWRQREDWPLLLQAYARCVRITRDLSERYIVDDRLLSEAAEVELHQAVIALESQIDDPGSIEAFLSKIETLLPTITKFFEDVLVMVEDEKVRQNRLGLLQQVSNLAEGVADLSFLEGF